MQTSRLIPASREDLFHFLTDLLNVPEQLGGRIDVEFPSTPPPLKPQAEFEIQMSRFSVTARIIARVEQLEAPTRFGYRQVSGFFRSWSHVMLLEEHAPRQTLLTDIVDFEMPGGILGHLADDLFVRSDITRLLNYRAFKVEEHFEREARNELHGTDPSP